MDTPVSEVTSRPILFSGEMVRAILDGRKTMTRRVMNPQPSEGWSPHSWGEVHKLVNGEPDPEKVLGCGTCDWDGHEAYVSPYKPGNHLWVRETWRPVGPWECRKDGATIQYRADQSYIRQTGWPDNFRIGTSERRNKWHPSIHMPRWVSRITLEVTAVRVERLQDISNEDAIAEGLLPDRASRALPYLNPEPCPLGSAWRCPGGNTIYPTSIARYGYRELWDSINARRKNGAYAWAKNPWVWCMSFRRVKP